MRMKLMTQEIRKRIPELYSTDNTPIGERVIHAKFFHPWSKLTWYASEFDGTDLFYGYTESGQGSEWGYFSLKEMGDIFVRGCWMERDRYFGPIKIKDCNELKHLIKEEEIA
tara:strand:+ start:3535 stop:3870 length:336 start_codon:yes stop_codon:yes gene_type:complete